MEENKDKQYYLTVKNPSTGKMEKVFVTEEVYRAYVKPIRKEKSQQRRDSKCLITNKFGNLVHCTENCLTCQYYLSGQKPGSNGLSIERFAAEGLELADERSDPEAEFIKQEEQNALHKAISALTPHQQEIVKLVYFEGKTQEEVAAQLGITRETVKTLLGRALEKIKKYLI